MKKIRNICSCLLLAILPLTSGAQIRDSLFFKNGSVLVGQLKSISLGKVMFDEDNMDILNIKVTKIRALKALTHIYRVETIGGRTFFTTLEMASEGHVTIRDENNISEEMPLQDIRNLVPLSGKTGDLWKGNASAGYTYSKSSGTGQFNSTMRVEYLTRKVDVLAGGSAIFNQTDSTAELSNATASLFGSYMFTPVWEANVFVAYQRNLEQGLSRRYQEGAGIGCNFLNTPHIRMKAISGVVFSQEKSIEGIISPTQVDIPVYFDFSFFRFNKPDMTLSLKEDVFVGITQAGRIRQDGQLNLNWQLIHDFYINIQFYHNFDNQPPGQNSGKLDYGVVFGLSYKFSE